MTTQAEKAEKFQALHRSDDILVLPNAYDAVSACVIAAEGFEAIATTSGGCAFSVGYCDGENMTRDQMAEIVGRICNAVDIPVSADMEAGYGKEPGAVAATIAATIESGAVGINIEDGSKGGERVLIDFDLSVERIRAARKAIDDSGIPMVLNARTDAFMTGEDDPVAEATRRANAYLESGADCTFVIGVSDAGRIGQLANGIDGPLNVLAGASSPSIAELKALGVKRVTFGSGFAKAAMTLVQKGARELKETGTYGWVEGAMGQPDIHRILKGG